MKTRNIPKCIREGLFCFMTGAMVFAGSAITAQAEEGDALPQDNDISSDINNSHDDEVENTAASITDEAGDATDGDYGDPVGEPSVETESGDYYETVTTTIEYEESGTDYESTTTVTTETTTYDVENPEYFNKEVDNTDITNVEEVRQRKLFWLMKPAHLFLIVRAMSRLILSVHIQRLPLRDTMSPRMLRANGLPTRNP